MSHCNVREFYVGVFGYACYSREDFLRIPELAINPLSDRIVQAFFMQSADDNSVS